MQRNIYLDSPGVLEKERKEQGKAELHYLALSLYSPNTDRIQIRIGTVMSSIDLLARMNSKCVAASNS